MTRKPALPKLRGYKKITTNNEKTQNNNHGKNKKLNIKTRKMDKRKRDCKTRVLTLVRRFIDYIVRFVFQLIYKEPGDKVPPITNLLLLESATSLAYKIRVKKLKSEDVVQAYINRIKEINPLINCVVDNRFDDALADARKIDKLIESGEKTELELEKETPFLGVPFTTKDAISVQGLSFTAGMVPRKHIIGERDADTVALLRKAGGIPLAITNVSEVCMWWESHNKVYGRTKNAYNINRIVGGSSGGEACLQSAAGSPMGIGSDIGGSIRMPCFFNGIFGHKASTLIVSNDGEYPIPSTAHNTYLGTGPMCRYASDLLPMYKILAGKNVHKLKLDQKVDITKLKIYYMEDDGGSPLMSAVHPDIKNAMRKVITHFEKAYKIKAEKVHIEKLHRCVGIWFAKMRIPDHPDFCEQMANLQGRVNLWTEIPKWFLGLSNHTFVALLTGMSELFGVQPNTSKYDYLFSLCDKMRQEFQDLLGEDGIFLFPTHPTPAPFHNEPVFRPFNFAYTGIFNVLGLPATACPLGLSSEGVPMGIQVVGALNQDHLTIATAVELEKAFGGWVPPALEE